MKYKKILALSVIGILAAGVMSCSNLGREKEAVRVAMVTEVGGIKEQPFNSLAWEGLQKAEEELGITASYIESSQKDDYSPNLDTLLNSDNDLIWGVGMNLSEAVKDAAKNNPQQKYAIIDHSYGEETPPNLLGVIFKEEESSFLVGYIASSMSETGTVGFVGGLRGEVIDGFEYGYKAGVDYANRELGKNVEVITEYTESFDNPARGKSIANSIYQRGADIVFHAAGGSGIGVIESAKEKEKFVIGADSDQNHLAPENVLTSAVKRVDLVVFNIVEELVKGNFQGGTTKVYGLEEGAVDIAPTTIENVPRDILDKVEEIKARIISGDIKVPINRESYEKELRED